ncbi:hypothetical protein FDECE_8066 [Fusarium decemcellulare]|nr:hypothetical protein FDECE_8066 [Fusarium decemcellulare]
MGQKQHMLLAQANEDLNQFVTALPRSDLFWILTIFLLVNLTWIDWQLGTKTKKSEHPRKHVEKATFGDVDGPNSRLLATYPNLACLERFIISPFRQYIAVLACSFALAAHILETCSITLVMIQSSMWVLKATYPQWKPYTLGFILYSPLPALMVAGWYGTFKLCTFCLSWQLKYIYTLLEFRPVSPPTSKEKESSPEDKEQMGID